MFNHCKNTIKHESTDSLKKKRKDDWVWFLNTDRNTSLWGCLVSSRTNSLELHSSSVVCELLCSDIRRWKFLLISEASKTARPVALGDSEAISCYELWMWNVTASCGSKNPNSRVEQIRIKGYLNYTIVLRQLLACCTKVWQLRAPITCLLYV